MIIKLDKYIKERAKMLKIIISNEQLELLKDIVFNNSEFAETEQEEQAYEELLQTLNKTEKID